jgi:hypothetical protein
MTIEKWLPVPEWESAYIISNLGQVARVKKNRCNLGVLKGVTLPNGYISVHLRDSGREDNKLIHRLVLLAFIGEPEESRNITNHKNGNRADNRLCNLEWVSHSENNLHAFRVLNREPICMIGMLNGNSKLTEKQVLEIRRLYAKGNITQATLARQYNVTQGLIGHIVKRRSWTHI